MEGDNDWVIFKWKNPEDDNLKNYSEAIIKSFLMGENHYSNNIMQEKA